ncbi:hypothetical protein RJ492_005670 [Pluralibacter gergoviae]|uniref:Phage protein n=1 Tax=Pluralibacter gergoviae TaxID=61647 RepID=A0AAI9DRQ3_PLUGE|nr:hypothetical protein [Pluralibacter gergoviae]EKV9911267.1 hypothetical protein [Pluralibacter gergoviae]EKW7277227.1 hypothetical protein [Pluralibacter gergoviae]ELD4298719.1 hypothetical protein [Pluralibacter gergoviae]ELD4309499.1 hypothetical protein [Pluralibacter gergoviae]
MVNKLSWFQHTDCTTEQADRLMIEYRIRGFETERSLNSDFLTWTVSVKRPEIKYLTPTPKSMRQRLWG